MLVKGRKKVAGVGRLGDYPDVVRGPLVFARGKILEDQTLTMLQIKLGTFRAHAEIGASNIEVPQRRSGFDIHPWDEFTARKGWADLIADVNTENRV
jgi:hypothetical protein